MATDNVRMSHLYTVQWEGSPVWKLWCTSRWYQRRQCRPKTRCDYMGQVSANTSNNRLHFIHLKFLSLSEVNRLSFKAVTGMSKGGLGLYGTMPGLLSRITLSGRRQLADQQIPPAGKLPWSSQQHVNQSALQTIPLCLATNTYVGRRLTGWKHEWYSHWEKVIVYQLIWSTLNVITYSLIIP